MVDVEEILKHEQILMKTSRDLYTKGLDLASDFTTLREFISIALENSEKCYASGLLEAFWAIREKQSSLADKIYKAYFDGIIPAETAGDALKNIGITVGNTKDKMLDNLKTHCGCRLE